jgi:hypothetical protein
MHAASSPNFLSAQALDANNNANSASGQQPTATQQPQQQPQLASYTSDEMAFHRLFPQVPLSEKLVESFQCGLSRKKIVRMGRMYLTSLRICFHSSFMKENVVIDWDQVTLVEKKSNFVFEAVIVEVGGGQGERHFFSAFMYGVTDQAHKLMTMLWTVRTKYGAAMEASNSAADPSSLAAVEGGEPSALQPVIAAAASQHPGARSSSPVAVDDPPPAADGDGPSHGDRDAASSSDPPPTRAGGSVDRRPAHESPARRPRPVESDEALAAPVREYVSPAASKGRTLTPIPQPQPQPPPPAKAVQPVSSPQTGPASQQSAAAPLADASHEILKHFPTVAKSETVVDRFQCSYVSGVHRLGGLYITTNYILFHSLMMSEGLLIKFSDVASIEKEQTIIILDGIVVTTRAGVAHSFTSFVSRDAAFNILVHFLGPHKKKLEKERSIAAAAAAAAAAVKTVTPPSSPVLASLPSTGVVPATGNNAPDASAPSSSSPAGGSSLSIFRTATSVSNLDSFPRVTSLDEFSKVLTDFGTGLSPVSCFVKEISPEKDLPKGFTILDVFKELFDDETSFLDEYHEQRQDTARTWEPWRPALPGSPAACGQRKLLCTTIIRAVFATACPFTEFQRYGFMVIDGVPTLAVQFSGQAVGVMFSDAFRAESLIILRQDPSKGCVTVRVLGHIQFLRSVWVKGKILSTALDVEMPECYSTMTAMAVKRLNTKTPSATGGVPLPAASGGVVAAVVASPPPPTPPAYAPLPASAAPTSSGAGSSAGAPPSDQTGTVRHIVVAVCLLGLFFSVRGLLTALTFNTDSYFSTSAFSPTLTGEPCKGECTANGSNNMIGEMAAASCFANAIVTLLRPVVVAALCGSSVFFVTKLQGLLL